MTKRQKQKHQWYLKNRERLIKVHKDYYESHKKEIFKNCERDKK